MMERKVALGVMIIAMDVIKLHQNALNANPTAS
jgi:hypothetical protein